HHAGAEPDHDSEEDYAQDPEESAPPAAEHGSQDEQDEVDDDHDVIAGEDHDMNDAGPTKDRLQLFAQILLHSEQEPLTQTGGRFWQKHLQSIHETPLHGENGRNDAPSFAFGQS